MGLSIGTGLASSSKNADGACGRVSKPPWKATCTGECDWLSGLKEEKFVFRIHADRTDKFHIS